MGLFFKCYDITLYPPAVMAEIRQLFGAPFGLWERIKRGGTGSPPLRWMSGPDFLQTRIGEQASFAVVNLEFLPSSVLLRVNVQGKVFLLMGMKTDVPIYLEAISTPGTDERFNTCFNIKSSEEVLCTLACRETDFLRLARQWERFLAKP